MFRAARAQGLGCPPRLRSVTMNLEQYLPILLFILVGVAIGILPQVLGYILGPNKPDEIGRAHV